MRDLIIRNIKSWVCFGCDDCIVICQPCAKVMDILHYVIWLVASMGLESSVVVHVGSIRKLVKWSWRKNIKLLGRML